MVRLSDSKKFADWTFRPILQPSEKVTNSNIKMEFLTAGDSHSFAGDPPSNSDDAKLDPNSPVVIKVGIWDGKNCISKSDREDWFGEELLRHIKAVNHNSKADKIEAYKNEMSYLTFEGFNTVGLNGDVDSYGTVNDNMSDAEQKIINANRFLWYNRAQNATSDELDRKGSWGQGKFTLEAASRLGAQISWSIRSEPGEGPENVLMGQTTLRAHSIRDPKIGYGGTTNDGKPKYQQFAQFGYFSTTTRDDVINEINGVLHKQVSGWESYKTSPVIDMAYINKFRDLFNLQRKDESGLSIVIPYPHKILTDADALARAFIARWIIAIYHEQFIFEIRKNGHLIHTLNKNTIRELVQKLEWLDEEPEKVGSVDKPNPAFRSSEQWIEILDLLDFKANGSNTFTLSPSGESSFPSWTSLFDDHEEPKKEQERLVEVFNSGAAIKIIAKPFIKMKKKGKFPGQFEIILKKAPTGIDSVQLFARNYMILPFMEQDSKTNIFAIVHCYGGSTERNRLLELLRDSEGPAHLVWNPGQDKVLPRTKKWINGNKSVKYVVHSIKHLAELLKPKSDDDNVVDVDMFLLTGEEDIFDEVETEKEGPLDSNPSSNEKDRTIPRPKKLPIARIPSKGHKGMVRITNHIDNCILGKKLEIQLAYDTFKGNPFKRYSPDDFTEKDLTSTAKGVKFIDIEFKKGRGLVYSYKVLKEKWQIDIQGFDKKRDVYVDVDIAKVVN